MIQVIRADAHHFTDFGWLKTYWLFSFSVARIMTQGISSSVLCGYSMTMWLLPTPALAPIPTRRWKSSRLSSTAK